MLVAAELKGELARIQPARACCRRAELAGLLFVAGDGRASGSRAGISTLDHATARVAMQLAGAIGLPAEGPMPGASHATGHAPGGRRHLQVRLADAGAELPTLDWADAKACDRGAFLRGALLNASISLGSTSTHVEFVFRDRGRARELIERLRTLSVRARLLPRRGRSVVYLKGQEEVATLLRLTGANRALLDFEAGRVARDVRNRLNRLLNAEEANVDRTVRAADRQLRAIARLAAAGELERLPEGLRDAAEQRRRQPDADLDTLATSLGVSRSAVNHRLRRLVTLAAESDGEDA
ncbi:MAG TPA: DNA-binding protein WhiA [Candidatus Limnocylindria bacterium]|jgi:DNA-binding transcriptional regulator WhiA|nr:DNA-binding protein WhiA [Candidatus Limnocylindria bacterium]